MNDSLHIVKARVGPPVPEVNKTIVGSRVQVIGRAAVNARVQAVNAQDSRTALGQRVHNVRANKARPTRHQDLQEAHLTADSIFTRFSLCQATVRSRPSGTPTVT